MSDKERTPNFDSPLRMQSSDPEKVICKDCAFRDKTTFEHNGRIIKIGAIKSWCKVYTKKISNGKPTEILTNNADCKYYEKDAE